jgi:hypothetical protein
MGAGTVGSSICGSMWLVVCPPLVQIRKLRPRRGEVITGPSCLVQPCGVEQDTAPLCVLFPWYTPLLDILEAKSSL